MREEIQRLNLGIIPIQQKNDYRRNSLFVFLIVKAKSSKSRGRAFREFS
jgi:hypothetical protein